MTMYKRNDNSKKQEAVLRSMENLSMSDDSNNTTRKTQNYYS